MTTLYETLDIPAHATSEEIKRAYRKAAMRWHPDRNVGQENVARATFLDKCSRKIDLKFRAIGIEELCDLSINGFLGPGDETPPVILRMLPDDFDQVQLGTVGRQIEEDHAMFEEPAVDRCLIDVVMNRGVVEHHHRHQTGQSVLRDLIKEPNNSRTFDGGLAGFMLEQVRTEIKCTED